jgi:transposase
VVEAINKRGYKTLFMLPYSSFLNPIEECWSKIKSNIKRSPLDKADTLDSRLPAACQSVTAQDFQRWVKYAETFWDRCVD